MVFLLGVVIFTTFFFFLVKVKLDSSLVFTVL